MKDLIFEAVDQNGETKEYEILYTFENDNKKYMIYTSNTYTGEELDIYFSTYDLVDDKYILTPITNEEEYQLVNKKMQEFIEEEI